MSLGYKHLRRCCGILSFILCATFVVACGPVASADQDWVRYVNPLVGSDSQFSFSNGNTYPAICLPFGMTTWTPQTGEHTGWIYSYAATTMNGIKATHQPSPWMGDYGDFAVMPVVGQFAPSLDGRKSRFDHANEVAEANYYRVYLDDHRTTVELTPTTRCSFWRIAFPQNEAAYLVFDVFDKGEISFDQAKDEVRGVARHNRGGIAGPFGCRFVAKLNLPIVEWGTFAPNGAMSPGSTTGKGLYVKLDTSQGAIAELRLGTSFINEEQAATNLDREIGNRSFEQVRSEGRVAWNQALGKVEISSASDEQLRTFYSCMYRAQLFPRIFHETDEKGATIHYSPYDGQVHSGEMYADNGFWDTFRAVYPLFSILDRERQASMIRGWLNAYREGGWLPTWSSPGYRDCMIGTHLDSVIADALCKNVTDFDIQTAYQACRRNATDPTRGDSVGREGLQEYIDLGYVPCDRSDEATARTLEYAYDDWCVAQIAKRAGETQDAELFQLRSQNYRNVFDPEVKFMRGRLADGNWKPDFSPTEWGGDYTEASAWHYLWSVMHDVPGLIELMGGDEAFAARLDEMLESEPVFEVGGYGQVIHEMTEMAACNMGQYAHGNQPVHHVLYLYNYAGMPWKGAPAIRKVVDTLYSPDADGYCGDEDNGQMSAWYIFSTLGFYPVCPGKPAYAIGTPRFEKATLRLNGGKTLEIVATGNSAENMYVQSATLNGAVLDRSWIHHDEILGGGTLVFEMGPKPNESWGRGKASRPFHDLDLGK